MRKPMGTPLNFTRSDVVRSALGVGILLSAAVLGACESPFTQGSASKSNDQYANSLVTRATMDVTSGGDLSNSTTHAGGVRELTGPAIAGPTVAQADQAVVPAGTQAAPTPGALSPAPTAPTPPAIPGATTIPGGSDEAVAMTQATPAAPDPALYASMLDMPENQLNLSLQEAIARSLKNALTIKVEAFNPAIKETQIVQAEAAFDPILFGNSNWSNNNQPTLSSSPSLTNGQSWQNQIGVKEKLATGGTAQIGAGFTYQDISASLVPAFARFQSSFSVGVSLTQPLLRGFGTDVNKADIYLAQRDRRISLSQFRQQVIKTVSDVETAYYQLMLAKANVYVQERLLRATLDTKQKIDARRDIDADAIQTSQVQAAVEARAADLIRARTTLRNASDQLKNAINDPDLDIRGNGLINPTDKPISEPIAFNVGEQIDLALRQRPELQQARLQIERADIVLVVAKNALLPKADVTLSVQSNGLDNSFETAFNTTVNPADFVSYAAGINVEIPIGNRAAESQVQQTKLQREQVVMQLVQAAQGIVLDVKLQMRDVLTSYQEIQARSRSRIAAANEINAIIKKENIVQLTPEFLNLKLQAQSDLAQAELSEISSVIGYNLAITKLEAAKGTLLEYNRIAIDKPPQSKSEEDFGKIRFLGETYTVK